MPAAADEADAWMPGILICGLARRSNVDARKEIGPGEGPSIDPTRQTAVLLLLPFPFLPSLKSLPPALGTRVNGHLSEQQTERVAIMQWGGDTGSEKAKNTTCFGAWGLQTKRDLYIGDLTYLELNHISG